MITLDYKDKSVKKAACLVVKKYAYFDIEQDSIRFVSFTNELEDIQPRDQDNTYLAFMTERNYVLAEKDCYGFWDVTFHVTHFWVD